MRFINRERCSGKTSMLIHTAYITGMPIITPTEIGVKHIIEAAKRMGCEGIDVYTDKEFKYMKYPKYHDQVLIDEAPVIISRALNDYLGCNVVAGTMSIPMDKLPSDEK